MQAPCHQVLTQKILHRLKLLDHLPMPQYQGTHAENLQIDTSTWQQHAVPCEGMRRFTWRGAAGAYFAEGLTVAQPLRATRILIIGAGPAGILTARALANAGLSSNITIVEKTGKTGGVWEKRTLKRILQAVPFPLHFEHVCLQAGPRPGQEITSFLETLVAPPDEWKWPSFPRVLTGEVVRVCPGDLAHRVLYKDEHGQERTLIADIVINAIGVGEPLHPSYSAAITTDLTSEQAGIRWQEVWSEEEARRYQGRKLVFVSLSNATLSMLWQIQKWNRKGMAIDYKVISHYPEASLSAPHRQIVHNERTFQLYRNLERFQLLRMAGDMHPFRQAFLQARDGKHVLPHIRHWTRDGNELVATDEQGHIRRVQCDTLYTLIGYAPRAETLEAMGLLVNHRYMGGAYQDYDGEAQREPGATGRARVWPGYFCLGIRNGFNENEVLLPGILYRLSHLVAGVLIRAAECAVRNQTTLHTN